MNLKSYSHIPARENSKDHFNKLTIWKSAICVVLSFVLAFGLGTNLSYASEFLPKAPEPEYVTLLQTDSKTLNAPQDGTSYMWQIKLAESDTYVTIPEASDKQFAFNAGLIDNDDVLKDGVAMLRCNVIDENGEWIAQQLYQVTYLKTLDNLAADNSEEIADALQDPVESQEFITSSDAENADTCEISVQYYSGTVEHPVAIGNPIINSFGNTEDFTWKIQSKTYLGKINQVSILNLDSNILNITHDDKSIRIKYNNYTLPENISIAVYTYSVEALYNIQQYLQNVEQSEWVKVLDENRTGTIGTYVPNSSKGERDISGGIRVQEVGMNIKADNTAKAEVYFTRKYTLAEFDTEGCVQAPEPRYNMYGKKMYEPNEIVEVSDGVYSPGPVPVRTGFTFKGWYIDDETKILSKSDWEQMVYQSENVKFKAKWVQDSETAAVTIYYYGQNAEQIGSEDDPDYIDKNYSWIAERYENGNVGDGYFLKDEQVCPRDSEGDISEYSGNYPEYFQCGSGKLSQAAKVVDSSTDPDIVVKNDGSTFVKVYLKRNVYEWKFYDAGPQTDPDHKWEPVRPTSESQLCGSIQARWGQDISDAFKQITEEVWGEKSYPWWVFENDPATAETASLLVYMDRVNRNTFDYCFIKCYIQSSYKSHARYYTQNLNSAFEGHASVTEEDMSGNFTKAYDAVASTDATTSEVDFINIVGFDTPEADGEDGPKPTWDEQDKKWVWPKYENHGFSFYYKRHTHKLYLAFIKGDGEGQEAVYRTVENVPYGLPLADVQVPIKDGTVSLKDYIPEKYEGVDPNYVFAGWTLDSNTDEGEIIDWETDKLTMQDYDSNIYAKWVAPEVSVSLDNTAPFQPGTKTTSMNEHYASNIQVSIPEVPVDSSGRYVFKSWYYLKDPQLEDEASNRVYFDPSNMPIPAEVIGRATDKNFDMDLKLEYTDTKLCDYKINYIYKDQKGNETILATPTEGAGRDGDELTVFPKPTTELSAEYVGMYTPKPDKPSIEIVLDIDQDNEYTFYYNLTGAFKYRVEYWDTTTNSEIYHKEVLDYSEGRTVTEKALESSDVKIGKEYSLNDDVYKTIVLVADDSAETWNNVIRFNYVQQTTELHYQVSSASSENGGTLERHDEEKQTIRPDGSVHEDNVPIKTTDKAIGVTAVPNEDWQFEYWYVTLSGQRVEGWTSKSANLEPYKVVAGENWKAYTFVAVFSYRVFDISITNHFKDGDQTLQNKGGIRLVQNVDGDDVTLVDVKDGNSLTLQVTNTSTYAYKYDKDATNNIRETIYMTDVRYKNEQGKWVEGSGQFMIVAYDHTGSKYAFDKWQLNNTDATVSLDESGQVIPVSFDKSIDYSFDAYYQRRYFTLTTVAGEHGSISPEGSVGSLSIPYGERLTFDDNEVSFSEKTEFNLQANADTHYVFDHWGIKEAGKDEVVASGDFTLVSDTTLTAYFSLEKHKTTYKVSDDNTGYLNNGEDGNFDYGTSYSVDSNVLKVGDKQISAIANNGYKFEKWCIGTSTEAITSGTIEGETNFVAYFVEKESFQITFKAIYWPNNTHTVDKEGRAGIIEGSTDGVLTQICRPVSGVDSKDPIAIAESKPGFILEGWYMVNSEGGFTKCSNVDESGKITIGKNGSGVYEPGIYYASFEEDMSGKQDATITYNIKTLDANGDDITNSYTGGTVGGDQTIHPVTGKPSSTAKANDGFNFVKWVNSKGSDVTTNLTIEPEWDLEQHIFIDTEYTAVFQEKGESGSDLVTIYYKARAMDHDGKLIENLEGGCVDPLKWQGTPVTGIPTQATAQETVAGFKFEGWYYQNPSDNTLNLRSKNNDFQPTKGNNEIWVDGVTYVAIFKEAQTPEDQVNIKYGTLTCSKQKLFELYENAGGSISVQTETLFPYCGEAQGSEVTSVNNGYHFWKWVKKTGEGKYEDVGTDKKFIPQKEDDVYKPAEYYAVFTTYDVTVHVCVAYEGTGYEYGDIYHNGQKVSGEYSKTMESASKYNISNVGVLSFYKQNESVPFDSISVEPWLNCNYMGYVLNETTTKAISEGVVYGTGETEYYKNNEYFAAAFLDQYKFSLSYEVASDSKIGDSLYMGGVGLGDHPESYVITCHEDITAGASSVQGATAKENNGFEFEYWTKDDESTQITNRHVIPEKDGDIYKPHTYYAHFKEKPKVEIKYNLDCDVSDVEGVNPGSISKDTESILPATGTAVGSTASAADGFEFKYWYYTDSEGHQVQLTSGQTLTPQKEDGVYISRTYTAHFEQLKNITVTYKVEDKYQGIDPGEVALGDSPESGYGSSVSENDISSITGTLQGATAKAFNGYTFKGWKCETTIFSSNNYYLPSKDANKPWTNIIYYACFEENKVDISYAVKTYSNDKKTELTGFVGGTLDRKSDNNVLAATGSVNGVQLTKNNGFTFDGWFNELGMQVAGSEVEKFVPEKEGSDSHKAYASHQYYAKFHEDADITITYKVKQLNDQSGDLWPGLIDGKTTCQEDVAPVSEVPVGATVTPNQGYAFVGWYAEGSTTAVSTNPSFVPQKSLGVYSSVTYNAVFKAIENTNYKVCYWFQNYDKAGYAQRLDQYPNKKFNDLPTETVVSDFARYQIESGVPGFVVTKNEPIRILGSDPADESTWTTINIYYDLRIDNQFTVQVYIQNEYVQGDVQPSYTFYESFSSYEAYVTGQWVEVSNYTYDDDWRQYSWAYDFMTSNTATSEDNKYFQIGENGTTVNLYYKVIQEAKYTLKLYRDKVDNTNEGEQWEETPFQTITDLKYYPNTTFKPHYTLAGYDYTNSDEGKIIPGPKQPQPEFKVYLTRQSNIEYMLVYMIQDYNQETGEVIPGQYHPAQEDDYYQELVDQSDFTYVFSNGITATKVEGTNLPEEYWNRDLLGFTLVDKYDPNIEGEGWCTVNGDGLDEASNAEWWKGPNIIRRYYDKKYFTLNVHYAVPVGFDNPEYSSSLPTDYIEYYHMINEPYSVKSPDLYSRLTLEPDRDVVTGVMLTENVNETVTYHETKLIHVDNVTNDASLGWVDEPTFEYGYYHGLHNGETHDITAHANDNAHFVCWKNEADEVVSTSPTLTLKREIDESDPKPVDIQDNANQILLSAKYTAVFEANETPSPDGPENWDAAQTNDKLPVNLGIIMLGLVILACLTLLCENRRSTRKKKING